jgi:alpha-glucosidase
MTDVPIPPEKVQDPWERNVPGLGLGRDPARTPMQWDATAHAGFTTAEPWLPLGPDRRTINVAAQTQDPRSVLSLYRALIGLRRTEAALSIGAYSPVGADENILSYERRHEGRRFLVVLNMSARPQMWSNPGTGRVVISTSPDRSGRPMRGTLDLDPDEGCIVALE